jgi:hypothetical protein
MENEMDPELTASMGETWDTWTKIWSKKLKGREHMRKLEVNRVVIFRWLLRNYGVTVEWIHLAQEESSGRWGEVGDANVNRRVLYNVGSFLSSWATVSFPGRALFQGASWLVTKIRNTLFSKSDVSQLLSPVNIQCVSKSILDLRTAVWLSCK